MPLYIIIGIWFFAGKYLHIDKKSIARLLIYIIAPVIIFLWVYKAEISPSTLSLPILFFILGCFISLLLYFFSYSIYGHENTFRNILGFIAGTWNTGYFWLPVVFILFWDEMFSLAVLSILWLMLYENTLWFFLAAKWQFPIWKAFSKVMKLPNIYAFFIWLWFNIFDISIYTSLIEGFQNFKWAYSVLGMMMIWMWLSGVSRKSFDIVFSLLTLFAKFIIWPIFVSIIIFLDMQYFNFYNSNIYSILFLISITPLAGNSIALAIEFKEHPDSVTLAVLLSTMISLVCIPLSVIYIFPLFW